MQVAIKLAAGNFGKETQKAIGLDLNEYGSLTWLPKSQIEVYSNHNEPEYQRHYIIVMPIWLAKAKGFWGYNNLGQTMCWPVNEEKIFQIAQEYTQEV
jgi:hypothetical protein